MSKPERPEDFSDEEYLELCRIQEKADALGVNARASPEYIRVGRKFITVTMNHLGTTYSPDIR